MSNDQGTWSAANQFIRHGGKPVAMADTPDRAHQIVAALNAQEAGWSIADSHYQQRLADVRSEFTKQLEIADLRATRAEERGSQKDEVHLMCSALRLIDRHGCKSNTRGRCWDAGYVRGAEYGEDAWCDACIAADALAGTANEAVTR